MMMNTKFKNIIENYVLAKKNDKWKMMLTTKYKFSQKKII